MRPIQETAFRTKTAMGAIGQISFHSSFLPVQHLFDLLGIDGSFFLIGHIVLRLFPAAATSIRLPGSASPGKTVFAPDQEAIQEEKEHVTQFREWNGDEHELSRQNVKGHDDRIIKPLMISQESGEEGTARDEQDNIIVQRSNGPNPGQEYPSHHEERNADQNHHRQPIGQRFVQTPKAQSPRLIQQDIMSK